MKKKIDLKTKALMVIDGLSMYYSDENLINKKLEHYKLFEDKVYKIAHSCLCEYGIHSCKHKDWLKELNDSYEFLKKEGYI